MGARGPAPKPTALRLLQGDHKERINRDEPIPADGRIGPPPGLSADALKIWKRKAPDLIRTGVLKTWDVDEFSLYCDAVVRNLHARRMLDELGEVVAEPIVVRGEVIGVQLKRNPWMIVWKQTAEVEARIAAKFGLTPSDRAQVKVGGSDGATSSGNRREPGRLLSS